MINLVEILSEHGLLIATHNQGKLREIQAMLEPHHIKCCSAAEKELAEPIEDGSTFIDNAMIKSVAAAKATNMPCLSDDSGLVVPALGGDPGIYSARWAGPNKDFNYAMKSVRIALEAKGQALDSEAYFVCVLSLVVPGLRNIPPPAGGKVTEGDKRGEALLHSNASPPNPPASRGEYTISTTEQNGLTCINVEGQVTGRLTFPPRGQLGFGYDPIFVPDGYDQTFAEIDPDAKQEISHRANAFRGLMEVMN